MNVTPTNMTVGEYCEALLRHDITVNRHYQRSDRVWPDAARSYLIESLILRFPLPKFTLYMTTDLKSKKTVQEIVDGQQRTRTIRDFYRDEFRLSRSLETASLRGKSYSQLDPEDQEAFITALLSIDKLIGGSRHDVRAAFRRMNSFTIPLNPEEHRHATFQGPMKWFIHGLAKRYDSALIEVGVFSEKQVIRMADTKLLSEICDAVLHGIRTTNKNILDRLYRHNDSETSFLENEDYTHDELKSCFETALDQLTGWEGLAGTNLAKPFIFYSLSLAAIHVQTRIVKLNNLYPVDRPVNVDFSKATENLLILDAALEGDSSDAGAIKEFVRACETKTNVKAQRETRFKWLCKALTDDYIYE